MEISNRMLAWLVVAAIVVSMTGTILSIGSLNAGGGMTTGFLVSNTTGNATVSISSLTGLTFSVATLDFGSGAVEGSGGYNCTMYINKTTEPNISKSIGCIGFNNETANGMLQLENTGNTWLNVTLNFTKNASEFIGGTTPSLPAFMFSIAQNETGSCTSLNDSLTPWNDVVSNSLFPICTGLNFSDSRDSLSIGINIMIPSDATGDKVVSIVAQGTG